MSATSISYNGHESMRYCHSAIELGRGVPVSRHPCDAWHCQEGRYLDVCCTNCDSPPRARTYGVRHCYQEAFHDSRPGPALSRRWCARFPQSEGRFPTESVRGTSFVAAPREVNCFSTDHRIGTGIKAPYSVV